MCRDGTEKRRGKRNCGFEKRTKQKNDLAASISFERDYFYLFILYIN